MARKSGRFQFDGGAGTYLRTGILAALITILTLGICYPARVRRAGGGHRWPPRGISRPRVTALLAVLTLTTTGLVPLSLTTADTALAASIAGSVSGRVTNKQGQPVPNVNVSLLYQPPSGTCRTGIVLNPVVTDASGNYTLAAVPAGTYRVQYSPAFGSGYPSSQYYQHTTDYSTATLITLTTGQTLTGIDDTLIAGGTITGTVSDATHPLAGIEVRANDGNGGFNTTATTGADGTYTVSGVTPGTAKVYFTDPSGTFGFQWYHNVVTTSGGATPVTVTDGQTSPGIDVTLSPSGSISGTVTDTTGTPLSNIQADSYPNDFSAGGIAFNVQGTPTSTSGAYAVRGLPTTNYHVNFRDSTGTYASSSYPSLVSVTAPGTTSGINTQLQIGGRITGTVTDSVGHPIPNVSINAQDQTGQYGFASTAADGTYTVTGLGTSGSYRVIFNVPGVSTPFYYQNATSYSAATLVSVTSGKTTSGIDLHVSSTGCTATQTTLSSSSNPAAVDDAVTFTATVAPSSGTGVPSGDVTFQDNGKSVAVSSVDSAGVATLTTSALPKGTHAITGVYSGDTTYATSSGTLSQSITPIATTAALTAAPNPTGLHAPATFTATIIPASGTTTPTGTVTFTDGTTLLGTALLNGAGVASLTTSTLTVGTHTVTADYPGDAKHSASTSNSVTQTVTKIATTTTVTSDANPATVGQTVTFTGRVTPATGSSAPTGQLTFNDGSTVLGTASLNSAGTATLATSQLSSGSHTIIATYGSDPSFASSTSSPLTETVGSGSGTGATGTTTALTSSDNPAAYGQWVTYTAQVLAAAGSGTLSGTVRLNDGAAPPRTATLDSTGLATFTLSSLSVGDHTLTATYVGDQVYASSNSAQLIQTISRAPTGVTLTSSTEPVTVGSPLTLTAAVRATAPFSGIVPAGTVAFTDGTAVLANVPIDPSGVAHLDTTSLSLGTHTLTANYLGSSGFTPATSSTLAVDVISATPGVHVTVQNPDGTTVANAMVVIVLPDGSTITGSTGSDGSVVLVGLPDGTYNVDALASADQVPGQAPVTVTGGTGKATVILSGGSLAKLTIDATGPLTPAQLAAAGISSTDPANSHVEQFIMTIPNVGTLCGFTNNTGLVSGSVHCDYPISATGGGSATVSVGGHLYTVFGSGNQVGVLESPGVKFLKEFFNVRETVFNLAGPSFPFTHGVAALTLPTGLSLAPTLTPQTTTPAVADVPGGGSGSASWIVRGDTAGLYTLTGSYQGILQPFGSPVHVTGTSATPLHVWGGDALKMIAQADTSVYAHHPYRVRIGLQNVADIPVYNASVGLAPQVGRPEYLFQPEQRMTFTTPQIDPGQTWWTDNYELLSPNSSAIDLSKAFIRAVGGDVTLASALTGQTPLYTPQTIPKLTGTGLVNAVKLSWDPIAGATGYEVFSTPTDLTPFRALPAEAAVGAATTSTTLPAAGGTSAWYAVTPLINGHETMSHPMVQVTALVPPPPPPPPPSTTPGFGSTLGGGGSMLGASTTGFRAEPVNTATGAYTTSHSDAHMSSLGVAFDLTRTYNSNDPASGPLGAGWTATPFVAIHLNENGSATVRAADGQQGTFLRDPDGSFTGMPGVSAQLNQLPTGWSLVTLAHLHYTFDPAGNLLAVTDRNGVGITLKRSIGQVSSVTDAAGRKVNFSYDTNGKLGEVALPDGRTTVYRYDTDHRLSTVTDATGAVTHYRYSNAGLLDQITDPDGHVMLTNTYDDTGRVTRQVNALGQKATFAWDPTTSTSTYSDTAGRVSKDVYDGYLLISQIDPLGRTTSYSYDNQHNRILTTDPTGRRISLRYTADGRPTTITGPNATQLAAFSYNSSGDPVAVSDSAGRTTHFSYDDRGNLTETAMGSGAHIVYTRDPITGAVSATSSNSYNGIFRLLEV